MPPFSYMDVFIIQLIRSAEILEQIQCPKTFPALIRRVCLLPLVAFILPVSSFRL